jgi:hypothetical protein
MERLLELLQSPLLLALAGLLGGIAAIWFFWDKLCLWPAKIVKARRQRIERGWDDRRREMFRELNDPNYLEWQQEILETLYQGLEIAVVFGRKYPAAIIRPKAACLYPFGNLCILTELKLPTLMMDKEQETYLRILGSSVKKPEMKGFALRRINVDAQGRAEVIEAVTTTYRQNLVTAHILEWELLQFYKRHHPCPRNLGEAEILKDLPKRARYHNARPGRLAIFEPAFAYPLISVQAIVVFRDTMSYPPTWRIVTAKRSDKVAVKPGYFQFKPAGGFEVYGKETDDEDYLVKDGFNIRTALFREYAEELFDAKHLAANEDECDPNSAVLAEPSVHQLIALINGKKASIDYLGVVVDLTALRHELSFLIVIEDEAFCKKSLSGSWEGKINGVPPRDLRSRLSGGKLHGSSAGLLQLAMESERLRTLGVSTELNDPALHAT